MTRYDEDGRAVLERGSDNGTTQLRRMAAHAAEHSVTKLSIPVAGWLIVALLALLGWFGKEMITEFRDNQTSGLEKVDKMAESMSKVAESIQQVAGDVKLAVQQSQDVESNLDSHVTSSGRSFGSLWLQYGKVNDKQADLRERIGRLEGSFPPMRSRWRTDPEME